MNQQKKKVKNFLVIFGFFSDLKNTIEDRVSTENINNVKEKINKGDEIKILIKKKTTSFLQ